MISVNNLKEYSQTFGIEKVVNDYGETRYTRENSIVFPNGKVASIVKNSGVTIYHPNGQIEHKFESTKKYSVAMLDYNGYLDIEILNQYGAIDGCIYCDSEEEIISACEIIRNISSAQ